MQHQTEEKYSFIFPSLTFLKTLSSPASGLRNPSVSLLESRKVTDSELQVWNSGYREASATTTTKANKLKTADFSLKSLQRSHLTKHAISPSEQHMHSRQQSRTNLIKAKSVTSRGEQNRITCKTKPLWQTSTDSIT